MSLRRFYALVCDGCGLTREHNLYHTPYKTRSMAKRAGWQRIDTGKHGRTEFGDYCPKCAADLKPTLQELEAAQAS